MTFSEWCGLPPMLPMAYFRLRRGARRMSLAMPSASTLVIVSGFTRPEFKVEVEVTAVRS